MDTHYRFRDLQATSSTIQRHLMDEILCRHAGEGPFATKELVELAEALHESLGGLRNPGDVGGAYKGVLNELVNGGRLERPVKGRYRIPEDGNELTSTERKSLKFRLFWTQNADCAQCGERMRAGASVHLDRIEPGARGGRYTERNCQLLCADCNLSKGSR
ncbi:MAG: HNH endonuclease signature motif containing protein [Gammaproteobacteria bacterium]|nr:HNH endonuclease signature motif containing protein [Gammaproteobacteria bacterium]